MSGEEETSQKTTMPGKSWPNRPGYRPEDVIARGSGLLPNRILCSVSHCGMPMRKSIIGHVGDTNFSEALRLIEELSARVTLFVHNVSAEKVLHFSEELVLCLKVPSPQGELEAKPGVIGTLARAYRERSKADGMDSDEALAGGVAPATPEEEYVSAAREFLQVEFLEITNWQGALYELREGPIAPVLAANDRAIKIRLSPAVIFKGFKIRMAAARLKEEKAPAAPPATSEQAQRVEELLRLLPGSYSKHLILR